MIRKVLLSTAALAAMSGTAFAADLPARRAPPAFAPLPIPMYSWTGFYIGAQAGYAFGRDTYSPIVGLENKSERVNGIIGGAHVGYNFSTQSLPLFGSAFNSFGTAFGGTGGVIGIEGDVDGSDYRRTFIDTFPVNVLQIRDNIQGSIRGRLGIAVDRALFYATGGAAFAEFRTTYTSQFGFDSLSHTRVGYTVGGGVEYAITNNFSLRAEYRYSDFGTFTDVAFNTFDDVRRHETIQRVQAGFSYKFDAPLVPVVARY